VERTATHDAEYVDIVLGYHHVLLFSLVFGALIFGTGYFIGYYRAQSDHASRAASVTTSPPASSPAAARPPVQLPAMLTQPPPPSGDVVKEMEAASTEALAPAGTTNAGAATAPAPAASAAAPAALSSTPQAPAPEATTPPAAPSSAQPAATPAAETPKSERQAPVTGKDSQPAGKPVPRAAVTPPNAGGNVYLQVSSFGEKQQAEQLLNELAAQGFHALIDGRLVEGKQTVLVGPFSDFKSAVGQAQQLKLHNREAFPIRR
jgi:cell division septation protein DedD